MTKHSFKKIIPLSVLVILLLTPVDYLISENLNYTISKPEVFKRNKASCSRLGNVYDACQWMTKVIVKNKGKNDISKLCILMKVNKKKYELCYGQTKKLFSLCTKSPVNLLLLKEHCRRIFKHLRKVILQAKI